MTKRSSANPPALGGPRRLAAPLALALTLTAFGAASAHAATTILDFEGVAGIPASYGDGPGVDVSYQYVNVKTGAVTPGLFFWYSGYGDLERVVFGGQNSTDFRSEIVLKALPGYEISLLSFDFATFKNLTSSTPISIRTLGGTTLFSETLGTNPGGHNHLAVNSAAVTDGIVLSWGPDGYNVALDNIAFDVRPTGAAAVPEPATWAMMILGFAGVGGAMRRQRRARCGSARFV
ncbi:PEPxxWA-CTERM sorting domain-containing protein [Phenylobacterium sp.]|uniref:PEPxxWA-CTERM sorting domain-containing protein n=1 Tax=Phenylobacterium sp. TaxID=1871053 RepID=UPI0025DBA08E|nr:PEPxxWA-CTERM sorting domain-containing protein [Phenylobacterium sp.]